MNEDKVKDYYSMLEKNGGCGPLVFAAVLVVVLLLASCRTVTVTETVPVETVRIEYRDREKVKEVHDSTFIDRWHAVYQKGDTVFDTKTITITKTITKTDTAYKVVERPVTVTQTETVEVKKPLAWWQKGLMWMGVIGLLGLMGWMGIKIYGKR